MRIAITGAAGSLMTSLHRRLRAGGREVLTLARGPVEPAAGDSVLRVSDPAAELTQHLTPFGPEVVILFPWVDSEGRDRRRRSRLNTRGLEMTAAAAVAAGARRIVFWGSGRVYERPATGNHPLVESDPTRSGGRGANLARAEILIGELAGSAGVELVVFRPVTVVGPRAPGPLRLLARLPCLPRPGSPAPLQFLHSLDAEQILERAVDTPHPASYNVAADGLVLHSELCRVLGKTAIAAPQLLARALVGASSRFCGLPPSALLQQAYHPLVLDNGRLKTHFGYRPRYSARQALSAALAT